MLWSKEDENFQNIILVSSVAIKLTRGCVRNEEEEAKELLSEGC